jgi:hypothetical protein
LFWILWRTGFASTIVIWIIHFQIKFADIRNLPFGLDFGLQKNFDKKGNISQLKKMVVKIAIWLVFSGSLFSFFLRLDFFYYPVSLLFSIINRCLYCIF